MKYLYSSHTGNFYDSDYKLSRDQLYCDLCRDTDEYVGKFKNEIEKQKIIEEYYKKRNF